MAPNTIAPDTLSRAERQDALTRFLDKYLTRGYVLISRTPNSAQLYKPARFPLSLFREQTRFLKIDEMGTIHVQGN